MKKSIYIILAFLLVMTGCNSNANKKSEELLKQEIRDEIRAEMEAKHKAEDKEKAEKEDKREVVDIKDKEAVIDFIFEKFNVSDSYTKENGIKELTFTYEDFNEDGNEDVVVYSPNKVGFYEVAFVSVAKSGYELIDGFEGYSQYDQSIAKEGNFIIYRGSGGGTGKYKKFLEIYRYVDGKITSTGTTLDIEGHDTKAHDDYPNGQPIKISSELIDKSYKHDRADEKWFAFDYTYMETDDEDKLLLKTCNEYHYNSETNSYEVYELEPKIVAKDPKKEAVVSNDKYEIEDLMSVVKLEDFVIKEVSYIKKNTYSLKLEGEISLKGNIQYDDMSEQYYFYSDDPFLDYPIRIEDDMKDISNYIEYAFFDKKWIEKLPKSARELLKEKGVLEITCTINKIEYSGQWGSGRGTSVEFTDIEALPNNTSEKSELEKNLSRFTNETLFSVDEEKNIDYSKYHLVIIPQQESTNDNKLGSRSVKVTDSGTEFPSRFAVLGEVMSLEFIYHENPLVEGSETQTVKLDKAIKDEVITVMSKMPYDQSYVEVKGLYMYQSAIEQFSFSLDSVRDNESYEILTFDAKASKGEY
ncbi:MAG: hypothetical protein N4A63_03130 [Vallitalea sp.]|jgi:hypothetical protein|nr:hypothetical protein [Vallitalea sp.]